MGLLDSLFGGRSSSTTTQYQDPAIQAFIKKLMGKAETALDMPYPKYTGERTAGPTAALGNAQQMMTQIQGKMGQDVSQQPWMQTVMAALDPQKFAAQQGRPAFTQPQQAPAPPQISMPAQMPGGGAPPAMPQGNPLASMMSSMMPGAPRPPGGMGAAPQQPAPQMPPPGQIPPMR